VVVALVALFLPALAFFDFCFLPAFLVVVLAVAALLAATVAVTRVDGVGTTFSELLETVDWENTTDEVDALVVVDVVEELLELDGEDPDPALAGALDPAFDGHPGGVAIGY